MKLAVISDLHVYSDTAQLDGAPPSYLHTALLHGSGGPHPFVALERLIDAVSLKADALVCCGDLGDRADPAAMAWAWDWVHRIGQRLGVERVYATCGNHDLDSRYAYNDFDARGALQALNPPYPSSNDQQNDKYWSRNFAIDDFQGARVVCLNTAAYHGGNEEYKHGRVAQSTLSRLESELLEVRRSINILVCHHHAYRFDRVPVEDYSAMKGGEALLQMLGSGRFGRWLVVHGHIHMPGLTYGAGSATSPVVFSAGSFSRVLDGRLATMARNQFYMVEIAESDPVTRSLGFAGTFKSWDWGADTGWMPAQARSGLPHLGAFGFRGGGDVAGDTIAGVFDRSGMPFLSWAEVCVSEPTLRYMLPQDLNLCIARLHDRGLNVILGADGYPVQVGKP